MILQKSGKQHWLTVPTDVVEANGWKRGDLFLPVPENDGIRYVRVRNGTWNQEGEV